MKVLITGSGGFIGSHLVEKCVELGYDVRAFIRYNSKNFWGWLEESPIKGEIEVFHGDIRDYDSVYKAMLDCQVVFHLAALIGIPYSYLSPIAYIRTNIEGTYNILESAKKLEVCEVIVTSTSETYGTAQYIPIDENHPAVGQSPYAATKIAADQLALSYHRSFGMPVKIVRPFNTYGPRQSARAVIPTIITQILGGKKEIKLGNLNPTRDLTFVKDTVKGFIEIYKSSDLIGQDINIGMNEEIAVGELAMLIAQIMGQKIQLVTDTARIRPDDSEVFRLRCDNTKLLQKTSWRPEYNIQSGLLETIEWVTSHHRHYKSEIYNV